MNDELVDAQALVAQQQALPDLQPQGVKQGGVDPDLTGGRNVAGDLFGLLRAAGHAQLAAQRVSGLNRLERNQFALAAVLLERTRHGREADQLNQRQAAASGPLDKSRRGRAVAADDHIAAQQLPSVTLEPALQAIGKKTHRRQGRDGQRHRQHQQAQLPRAPIAPGVFQTQLPKTDLHRQTIAQNQQPEDLR